MRIVVDLLIVLMIASLVAGFVWMRRMDRLEQSHIQQTRESLKLIKEQVILHSSMESGQVDGTFPGTIDPAWFGGALPDNPLLEPRRPWLNLAGERERRLEHPPDRSAVQADTAKFWYNPANGVVRARVPSMDSDETALELYNLVNGSSLTDLFISD